MESPFVLFVFFCLVLFADSCASSKFCSDTHSCLIRIQIVSFVGDVLVCMASLFLLKFVLFVIVGGDSSHL